MNRLALLAVFPLVFGACGGNATEDTAQERVITYFENGRVILGDGSPPIEDAALVVADGVVMDVGPRDQVPHPPGAQRYDLAGHTIVPFLHNLHGHVGYVQESRASAANYTRGNIIEDLDRYLYYGVGSVAVMGTDVGDTIFQIRDEVRGGQLNTARVFTAGRGITARGGFPTSREEFAEVPYQVATEEEARQAVRELVAQNVDFIKIWVDDNRRVTGQIFRFGRLTDQYSTDPKLSPALYGAIIDEAHMNNTRVVAHVRYLDDAKGLVGAGVDGLVHSIRDRAVDNALIEAMRENDVFYVPTLAGHQASFVYADEPAWLRETALRESQSGAVVNPLASRGVVGTIQQDPNLPMWRREYETAAANVKALFDAGIRIGLGTDSGTLERFPGFFEHRELELMVEAGIPPMEAIRIGTQGSAQILEFEDSGTLDVGKLGNFVLTPGHPVDDMSATRDIAEVFKNGRRLERSAMMNRFTM